MIKHEIPNEMAYPADEKLRSNYKLLHKSAVFYHIQPWQNNPEISRKRLVDDDDNLIVLPMTTLTYLSTLYMYNGKPDPTFTMTPAHCCINLAMC